MSSAAEEVKPDPDADAAPAFKFKSVKGKKKNFRKRRSSGKADSDEEGNDGAEAEKRRKVEDRDEDEEDEEEEEEEEFNLEKLRETQEIQKLRQRSSGISHVTLASGIKVSKVDEELSVDASDPFKLKTGGLLDLARAKQARAAEDPEAAAAEAKAAKGGEAGADDIVGTQFSKESRMRDEDEEMRKFIEAEMEKRKKGGEEEQGGRGAKTGEYLTPEDRALLSLPDHLRKSTFRKNEEMLSSQMLSGIPEVDLGIEEKIRNIEATEDAKKRMAAKELERRAKERGKMQSSSSEFVPNNLAVDYKRPDRFRAELEAAEAASRPKGATSKASSSELLVTRRTVVVGDVPRENTIALSSSGAAAGMPAASSSDPAGQKATDDLHLTKFKQHFQRK